LNVYIASSWKNRDRVRALAVDLRRHGLIVYDFTDPACRAGVPEIPPEAFPEAFDPQRHRYAAYLERPEWRSAVQCNRAALDRCDVVVLLLPCGADSHADWAYAVGKGKRSAVVHHPPAGERTPTHLWADAILEHDLQVLPWLTGLKYRQPAWPTAQTMGAAGILGIALGAVGALVALGGLWLIGVAP
jgi:hypothetical protein